MYSLIRPTQLGRKDVSFVKLTRNILLAGATCVLVASGALADTAPLKVSASAPTEVPDKFKNGEARIAVVRQLNVGDVYQAWIAGVEEEAKKLGVKVDIYNADGDNAKQALQLQQAVATEPDAILIGWGFGDSLKAGLDAACSAGIPVVTSNASVSGFGLRDQCQPVGQTDDEGHCRQVFSRPGRKTRG